VKATAHRRSDKIPELRHHKATGQGGGLNGRFIYLGRYDAPETRQRYHQVIAEWLANGRQLAQPQEAITITELVARFWRFAQDDYDSSSANAVKELDHLHIVLGMLREVYGHAEAKDFGASDGDVRVGRETQ